MKFQENYSKLYNGRIFNEFERIAKANQILLIIKDYYKSNFTGKKLSEASVLDAGCSYGIMDDFLSTSFKEILAVDIDENAIDIAKSVYNKPNITYIKKKIEGLSLKKKFDIVISNMVLEHVPNQEIYLDKIYSLINKNGICILSVPNKFSISKEPHYDIYFLSWWPQIVSNFILKVRKKGDYYYEKPVSWCKLKKLTRNFELVDYSLKRIKDPIRFGFEKRVKHKSILSMIPLFILKILRYHSPSFIVVLRKE